MTDEKSVNIMGDEIRRRFVKSFLDVLILKLVNTAATWGYDIIKKTETQYRIKLRHGALYPMLNMLEAKGLVRSTRELHKGRTRKIYEITKDGTQLLDAYYDFIREHLPNKASK